MAVSTDAREAKLVLTYHMDLLNIVNFYSTRVMTSIIDYLHCVESHI